MDERERITGERIDAPTRTRTRLYGTPENPIRSGGGPSRTTTHPLLAGKSRAQREREEADAFWARHDDHVLGPLRCRSEQDAAYMDAVEQVCTVPVLDAIPTLAINPHK